MLYVIFCALCVLFCAACVMPSCLCVAICFICFFCALCAAAELYECAALCCMCFAKLGFFTDLVTVCFFVRVNMLLCVEYVYLSS